VAATENRNVGEFERVRLDGVAAIEVTIGSPSTFSVTADDNLIGEVETEVEDGRLTVRSPSGWAPQTPVLVEATVAALDEVQVDGAGRITVDGLDAEELSITVDGTGSVAASGEADALEAELDGDGVLRLAGLVVGRADVRISGAGTADVTVEDQLKARVDGEGVITYRGEPELDAKVTGAGEVRRAPAG
jgi:carbon monoxide dehydrogenase subunit G